MRWKLSKTRRPPQMGHFGPLSSAESLAPAGRSDGTAQASSSRSGSTH
jgi:hypothetical protein